MPFLGDLRHFWVKVDKLYPFGKKIEIKALKMLFVVKWGSCDWICLAFEGVCVETQWVFWVKVGLVGLFAFRIFQF